MRFPLGRRQGPGRDGIIVGAGAVGRRHRKGNQRVLESAEILVKAGMEEQFEAGVRAATPLFRRARGCTGLRLSRGVENPRAYRLLVDWDTVEDHMVHFRNSADFGEWRRLVGDCFEQAPVVTHLVGAVDGF
jgi:heme-degrading monooxygenase HmoA